MYEYRARLVRVVDGDTIIVDVDLGFRIHQTMSVRLAGINAPEPRGDSRKAGIEASHALASLARVTFPLLLQTEKDRGKYGRFIATVWLQTANGERGVNLNERMVESGHAVKRDY